MDIVIDHARSRKNEVVVLVSLFIFELSLVATGLGGYLKGESSVEEFLSHPSGMGFGVALCALVISGAIIMRSYMAARRSSFHSFRLMVAMNLISVLLILVTGEIAVRLSVRMYFGYEAIGTMVLKAKDWEAIRRYYLKYAEQTESPSSFYMYDPDLGWTLRPNSSSSNGMYWSSAGGLRAPGEGVSFARNTGQMDIALVGNSYTFGEEVRYDESYGFYLGRLLGSQFRVLNFGVPGYGIGQMFLRYEKDVRPRKPKVVLLSFITHNVRRTLWVYTFLGDVRWNSPFAKPRFTLRDGELVKVTEFLPNPKSIFAQTSISELPFIELQPQYQANDWEDRFWNKSYLVRLFVSWATRLHETSALLSEGEIELNAKLIRAFVQSVKKEGSIPLVVFLPVGNELTNPSSTNSLGKQVLERAGIDYIDPTPCLLKVNPANLYRPDVHYTAEGNAAVAKCAYKAVKDILAQSPSGSRKLRPANDGSS